MDFDAVISIGGQAFLDGFWRMLGPALAATRDPLPIALPGLTGSTLRVRTYTPDLAHPAQALPTKIGRRRRQEPWIGLSLKVELGGDLLVPLPISAQGIPLTNDGATIKIDQATGALNSLTKVPVQQGAIAIDPMTGTLDLSDVLGAGLPAPAILPIPLDITGLPALDVAVAIKLSLLGELGTSPGKGLHIGVDDLAIVVDALSSDQLDDITAQIDGRIAAIWDSLLAQALAQTLVQSPPPGPVAIGRGYAQALSSALGDAVEQRVAEVLRDLVTRTGRLIASPDDGGAGCQASLLPKHGNARFGMLPTGALYLQLGFSRAALPSNPNFPSFTPTSLLDMRIELSNDYLAALLDCLLEMVPTITLPSKSNGFPIKQKIGMDDAYLYDGVIVTLGPFALSGALILLFADTGGGSKVIKLILDLRQSTSALYTDVIDLEVAATLTIAVTLSSVAALTSLLVVDDPDITVSAGLSKAVQTELGLATAGAFLVPGVGMLIEAIPKYVLEFARQTLDNLARTLLHGAGILASPVAIPPGVFDAFGTFVPAMIEFDDFAVSGQLLTPTSPWGLAPLTEPVIPPITGPVVRQPVGTIPPKATRGQGKR